MSARKFQKVASRALLCCFHSPPPTSSAAHCRAYCRAHWPVRSANEDRVGERASLRAAGRDSDQPGHIPFASPRAIHGCVDSAQPVCGRAAAEERDTLEMNAPAVRSAEANRPATCSFADRVARLSVETYRQECPQAVLEVSFAMQCTSIMHSKLSMQSHIYKRNALPLSM
jgi:hypothetical protein